MKLQRSVSCIVQQTAYNRKYDAINIYVAAFKKFTRHFRMSSAVYNEMFLLSVLAMSSSFLPNNSIVWFMHETVNSSRIHLQPIRFPDIFVFVIAFETCSHSHRNPFWFFTLFFASHALLFFPDSSFRSHPAGRRDVLSSFHHCWKKSNDSARFSTV